MTDPEITDPELIRGKIISETAQIPWKALQRHFAGGKTLVVDGQLDLIEIAFQFNQDNAAQVEQWLSDMLVKPVSSEQAQQWFDTDAQLWACVVRPWVLIQEGHHDADQQSH